MSSFGTMLLFIAVAAIGVGTLSLALTAGSTAFAAQMATAVVWAALFLIFIARRAKA